MDNLVFTPQIMSDYFYDPSQAWNPTYWGFNEPLPQCTSTAPELHPAFCAPPSDNYILQQQLPFSIPQAPVAPPLGNLPSNAYPTAWHPTSWTDVAQYQLPQAQQIGQFRSQTGPSYPTPGPSIAAPSPNHMNMSLDPSSRPPLSRTNSRMSRRSSTIDQVSSSMSRSGSPNANAIADYGYKNSSGSWSCAWPGCTSRSRFTRACDLRKHYKRHSKTLFCRHDGCPQATEGGFSSKKDRARHEAKHNPMITCEWDGCGRLFSRVDNMVSQRRHKCVCLVFEYVLTSSETQKDHVRRVHERRAAS